MSANLSKLEQVFNDVAASGFKTVRIRFSGLLFKRAPDSGRNAGAVYVMREQDYLGKIQRGAWWPNYNVGGDTAVRNAVAITMDDPLHAAITYGRRTGNCAICGRHLDNKQSVALGIGPICAEKFGFLTELIGAAPNDPDDSLDDLNLL